MSQSAPDGTRLSKHNRLSPPQEGARAMPSRVQVLLPRACKCNYMAPFRNIDANFQNASESENRPLIIFGSCRLINWLDSFNRLARATLFSGYIFGRFSFVVGDAFIYMRLRQQTNIFFAAPLP